MQITRRAAVTAQGVFFAKNAKANSNEISNENSINCCTTCRLPLERNNIPEMFCACQSKNSF